MAPLFPDWNSLGRNIFSFGVYGHKMQQSVLIDCPPVYMKYKTDNLLQAGISLWKVV